MKSTLGLTKIHCKPELKEITSWTSAGQANDNSSSPNPLVKFYEEAVIETEARTTESIQEWSIAINHDWVHN